MIALVDTNVVLDAMLGRKPRLSDSPAARETDRGCRVPRQAVPVASRRRVSNLNPSHFTIGFTGGPGNRPWLPRPAAGSAGGVPPPGL